MKKGTINTIADYLYKRPGSRFTLVFAFFLLEERAVERSKTPEERMFGQVGNPIRGDMCRQRKELFGIAIYNNICLDALF